MIVYNIVNAPPGRRATSGQALAHHRRYTRPTREDRRRGGRERSGSRIGGGRRGGIRGKGIRTPPQKRRGSQRGDTAWRSDRAGGRGGGDGRNVHGRRDPKGGNGRGDPRGGGGLPPPEENADLPDFTPESSRLLLREVYGDFPHHNNGSHLYRGVANDAIWQHRWCRLTAQSASLYTMPTGSVGSHFTAILAV